MKQASILKESYEPYVQEARRRLATDSGIRMLCDPALEPALFERFLIQYCSLGVYMTEPVEGWIRRAGEACVARGWESVGKKLVTHAAHEAGHHLMMMEDARKLVQVWNGHHRPRLNAEELLAQPPTQAVRDYIRLHEETIRGPLPLGQVAIEFEIERLSLVLGRPLLEQSERLLGREVLERLSFLSEHVAIDVGHTALNEKMLEEVLGMLPQSGPSLGDIGSQALDIYVRFLHDCLRMASASLSSPVEAALA